MAERRYIFSGVLPHGAIVDQQRLTLLGKVLTKPGPIVDVIVRKWAIKEATLHSCVIRTSSILML